MCFSIAVLSALAMALPLCFKCAFTNTGCTYIIAIEPSTGMPFKESPSLHLIMIIKSFYYDPFSCKYVFEGNLRNYRYRSMLFLFGSFLFSMKFLFIKKKKRNYTCCSKNFPLITAHNSVPMFLFAFQLNIFNLYDVAPNYCTFYLH
jgi:hypothetical protein